MKLLLKEGLLSVNPDGTINLKLREIGTAPRLRSQMAETLVQKIVDDTSRYRIDYGVIASAEEMCEIGPIVADLLERPHFTILKNSSGRHRITGKINPEDQILLLDSTFSNDNLVDAAWKCENSGADVKCAIVYLDREQRKKDLKPRWFPVYPVVTEAQVKEHILGR